MLITIIPSDGVVGVDRKFRKVDMAGIDPTIHAVQFDTSKNAGHIEYRADALRPALMRNAQAEHEAALAADTPEKTAALRPIMKSVMVRRDNEPITDISAFQSFIDRWAAADPALLEPDGAA